MNKVVAKIPFPGKRVGAPIEQGMRDNAGKPRVDLIPPEPILELGRVYEFGSRKYAEWNWLKGFKWLSVYASMGRHMLAWASGETHDKESGLHHMAHVMWGCCTLIHFDKHGIGTDDRPNA